MIKLKSIKLGKGTFSRADYTWEFSSFSKSDSIGFSRFMEDKVITYANLANPNVDEFSIPDRDLNNLFEL